MMYNIYIMKRTQLYLDDDMYALLKKTSQMEHVTISNLVRKAVFHFYQNPGDQNQLNHLMAAFGLWNDKKNFDTERYVKSIRKSKRKRFYQ